MHIPDGFISAPVATVGCIVAAGCVAYAVKATNKKMGEKQIPLMGVLDLEESVLYPLRDALFRDYDFEADLRHLAISGKCSECRKKGDNLSHE